MKFLCPDRLPVAKAGDEDVGADTTHKDPISGFASSSCKKSLAGISFPTWANWNESESGPYLVLRSSLTAFLMVFTTSHRDSPAGAPSVTLMMSTGFLSC